MGIKERRTKLLLALFLLSDVNLDPVHATEETLANFDIALNQKTRGSLSGMIKEGLLEKVQSATTEMEGEDAPKQEGNVYKLTEKGFHELCLKFPFVRFLRDKWDSKWRILSYEIPEKKRELRDRLRREVAGWGLGPWHRSFWLTPHPIIESLRSLVSQKEEEQYIQAFEADHVFGTREILIEKVWALGELDKKYRELFKKWHDILARDGGKTEKFKSVVVEYVNVLRLDPGLPADLVGDKWIGHESYNIFKEIKSILLG